MSFSDPQTILQAAALREGVRVGDFGTGSGHYAHAAARIVGERGRVFAVDIQKDLLARLKKHAGEEKLRNIEVVWGDIDEVNGSRLAPDSLDFVILANVLFQVEHRKQAALEAARVLKPGGRVLVVDWESSFGGMGPRAGDVLAKRDVEELLEGAGFTRERDISERAGDHHYALVFKKS